MTIGNYITEKLKVWNVTYSEASIVLELALLGYDAGQEMTQGVNLDRFFYNVIPDILMMPKSVSEGGYSITFDTAGMKAYYSMLAKRLGLSDNLAGDRIIDISDRW